MSQTLISWDAYAELFDVAFARESYHDARNIIDKGMSKHSTSHELFSRHAKLIEEELGAEFALNEWDRYLKKNELNPSIGNEKSRLYGRMLRDDEALAIAQECRTRFPNDRETAITWATLLAKSPDNRVGISGWSMVLKQYPSDEPLVADAVRFFVATQKLFLAEAILNTALFQFQSSALLELWASMPLHRGNRFASAQRHLEIWRRDTTKRALGQRAVELFKSCDLNEKAGLILNEIALADGNKEDWEELYLHLSRSGSFRALSEYCFVDSLVSGFVRPETNIVLTSFLNSPSNNLTFENFVLLTSSIDKSGSHEKDYSSLRLVDLSIFPSARLRWLEKQLSSMPNKFPHLSKVLEQSIDAHLEWCPPTGTESPIRLIIIDEPVFETQDNSAFGTIVNVTHLLSCLNQYCSENILRSYQKELFETGTLSFAGTFMSTGKLLGSAVHGNLGTGICVELNGEAVWLLSSLHSNGHKISTLVMPTRACVWSLSRDEFAPMSNFINQILDGSILVEGADQTDIGISCLLIGHQNYAHFLWNEISALIELRKFAPSLNLVKMQLCRPFGPWDDLLGVPSRTGIVFDKFYKCIYFFAGSQTITVEAKQEVLSLCKASANAKIDVVNDDLVLWISVRKLYRHLTNQSDYIMELCAELERRGLKVTIILDGFSLPWDIKLSEAYSQVSLTVVRDETSALAEEIVKRFSSLNYKNVNLLDITNWDLPSTIAASEAAHMYISSQGTQQHKIGWIMDRPGLIHTNKFFSDNGVSGEWVQANGNLESEALVFPTDLIELSVTNNARQDIPYFQDYKFVDVEAAVLWTLNYIESFNSFRQNTTKEGISLFNSTPPF